MDKEIQNDDVANTKYSVVLRFWNTPQELEVIDLVYYQNQLNKGFYYKFIDNQGRLWENVPENDVILIENNPGKAELEEFRRIKIQGIEESKKYREHVYGYEDVSVR